MSKQGTVYFFTGLAGAGKTTIGGLFYKRLTAKNPDALLRDGDQARKTAGYDGADKYSTEARKYGAFSLFAHCNRLVNQGFDVVCCSICMYDEVRAWNRANIENYKEIYIKVTMDTLYKRDQKKLYSSGEKNVVGVDLPWDEPKTPDVIIENDGHETPEALVEQVIQTLGLDI